jgi:hypothetical protein
LLLLHLELLLLEGLLLQEVVSKLAGSCGTKGALINYPLVSLLPPLGEQLATYKILFRNVKFKIVKISGCFGVPMAINRDH